MFERFTDGARRVVVLAQQHARDLNHNYIGTEHVLLGILTEENGLAAQALHTLGVDDQALRDEIKSLVGRGQSKPAAGHIPFTPRAKKVLELSLREALQLGHNYIGSQHILLGILREGEGVAVQALVRIGIKPDAVRSEVHALIRSGASEEPRTRPPAAARAETELLRTIADRLEAIQHALARIERLLGPRDPDD